MPNAHLARLKQELQVARNDVDDPNLCRALTEAINAEQDRQARQFQSSLESLDKMAGMHLSTIWQLANDGLELLNLQELDTLRGEVLALGQGVGDLSGGVFVDSGNSDHREVVALRRKLKAAEDLAAKRGKELETLRKGGSAALADLKKELEEKDKMIHEQEHLHRARLRLSQVLRGVDDAAMEEQSRQITRLVNQWRLTAMREKKIEKIIGYTNSESEIHGAITFKDTKCTKEASKFLSQLESHGMQCQAETHTLTVAITEEAK